MYGVVRLSNGTSVRVPLEAEDRVSDVVARVRSCVSLPSRVSLHTGSDGARLPDDASLRSLGLAQSGTLFCLRAAKVTGGELSAREALAAAFHIAVIHGWDQIIYNHFTCRASPDSFLVHRFGHLYSEVTASSLLEVSLESGAVVGTGDNSPFEAGDMPYNSTAYVIHSCIYKARADVNAVFHAHIPCIVAVASSKSGLKIGLSQESSLIGPVGYHPYEGLATSLDEQKRIVANLGSGNVLFLRNHGIVCCGRNVAHALHVLYHVWRACLIQVASERKDEDHFMPEQDVIESAFDAHTHFTAAGNHNLEFDAMIRLLLRNDPCHTFLH